MFTRNVKYQIWLHLIVVVFGFTAVLGKLITLPATTLVWYRMLIAVLGLLVYLVAVGGPIRLPRAGAIKACATGLLTALHWILFFESIKQSTVSVALVCLSSAAFFTALLEPIVYRRRLKVHEILFGLLVFLGLYCIFRFETQYRTGMLLGVLAALVGSLFVVINGKLVSQYDARSLSCHELVGGFIGISLYLFIFAAPDATHFVLTLADGVYLLVLGLVCTAFAFTAGIEVMKEVSPFTFALTINLEPVYGIVLALLIFGESERMTLGFYLGALLVILTIFGNVVVNRKWGPSNEATSP